MVKKCPVPPFEVNAAIADLMIYFRRGPWWPEREKLPFENVFPIILCLVPHTHTSGSILEVRVTFFHKYQTSCLCTAFGH